MEPDAHKIARLGGKDYIIKQVPMARVKRLGPVLADVVEQVSKDAEGGDAALTPLLDRFLAAPHAVLSLFIDDLPEAIFHDEDAGVTMPEMLDALEKAISLNRLDVLKKAWAGLGGSQLIQAGLKRMKL